MSSFNRSTDKTPVNIAQLIQYDHFQKFLDQFCVRCHLILQGLVCDPNDGRLHGFRGVPERHSQFLGQVFLQERRDAGPV